MKLSRKLVVFFATLFCTFTFSLAAANNGVFFEEIEFSISDPPFYVDCLGEDLIVDTSAKIAMHAFETPSGTYHDIGNWTWTSLWTGLSTGRTWTSKGVGPGHANIIGPGGVIKWSGKEVAKPLTGDGPKWISKNGFQMTVNAYGQVVVFRDEAPDFSATVRCLNDND